MANQNNRDVSLTLSVETLGADDIKKLQTSVSNLAKEGGDAAPEFQRLADEIGRLGDQAKSLQSFTELAAQTGELAARQEQAATNAADLSTRLAALSTAAGEAAERQRAAAAALKDAQLAARATRDELATLTAETDRAGKSEDTYAKAVSRLKLAKIEQRAEIERLSEALAKSNAEVTVAERAEAKLAASYSKAEAAAAQAARAVQANADSVRAAADAALELGVSTDDVVGAQAELIQALNRSGRAAGDLGDQVTRLAAAERELQGIRAFEEQAAAAERLQVAGDYARLFEEAIRNIAEAERALAQQQSDARWQLEAEAIVEAAHAAQELARQTAILDAAQRELAAQRAFEQQAEDAAQLIRAADYVREWEEQLQAAETQARETADAAEQASRRISGAFETLGVRSARDLELEIARVREAMRTVESQADLTGAQLDSAFDAGNERISDLERQLREVNGELTIGDQLAGLFANSVGQIAAGNLIADGIGFLINKVKELAVEFVRTIVETQNLRRALMAVYGDSKLAAAQFDFLKKTANNAGVAIGDIVQAFVKFSAATKASGISLEITNRLFSEVTRTAGILGLSGEQVTGMLEALGQMASKGTVSMEELRQQLGDRLPGALSLVAKGLGLTEAELVKLVESGGLAARDLFPALTTALGTMKGEATGLSTTWQRFKNILTETAQSAGDAGWADVLGGALKGLGFIVGGLAIVFSALSETIGVIARSAGILVGALFSLTNPMQALSETAKEAQQRHDKLTASILGAASGSQTAAVAASAHTKAMEDAGAAAAEQTIATLTTSKATEAQAFAAKLAADNTIDLSSKIVQLKAHIDTLLGAQTAQIEAAGRLAKAAKIEGDSLVQLAELRGKDFLSLEAQVTASDKYAAAVGKVSDAQRAETELLVLKRQEIIKTAIAQDGNINARKVELDLLEKKIVASRSETEQTLQATNAARQEAEVRRLAVLTYKDNSAAVEQYRHALEAAEKALAELTLGEKQGWVTKEQVTVATKRAAEAAHMYNDALGDSARAIDLESRAKQANMNLQLTKLQLEQKGIESLAQTARASGNYVLAMHFEIEARRTQIEIIKLTAEAKRLEAEATIKAIEVERAALDLADPMLKQKRAELDIRLANAKAKLLEADAGRLAISGLEREIDLLRNSNVERGKETAGRNQNADAIDRETAAIKKKLSAQYDEQNFRLNTEGKRVVASGDPAPTNSGGDWNYIDKNGVWRTSKKQPIKDPAGGYMDPAGTAGVKGATGSGTVMGGGDTGTAGDAAGVVSTPGPRAPEQVRPPVTQTVNVVIGSRTTPVTVASGEDAQALTSVLRQLESAAGAAR